MAADGAPKPCATGCGFFGNPATMDMCSKCYRQYKIAHPSEEAVAVAPNASAPAPAVMTPASSAVASEPPAKAMDIDDRTDGEDAPGEQSNKKRCYTCKKKVGLHGFKCKCGFVYCAIHRYADAHSCTFDYRAEAREQLARSNPAIRGEKVSRI